MSKNMTSNEQDIQIEQSGSYYYKEKTEYYPRLQTRKCGVFLVKTMLPDGKTVRILQILDQSVNFAAHPEFVQALNIFRETCYGNEGKNFLTKNENIPNENPEFVVHFAFIGTKNGKISGEKVFTKEEARTHLNKLRSELQKWRDNNQSNDFGTNLQDAINIATLKTPKAASIN